MSIDRIKYERAKDAARKWHLIYCRSEEELDMVKKELETTLEENKALQIECRKWKNLAEQLPDVEEVEEYRKTIRGLKKQCNQIEEKYKDKIAQLERDKILSEGKVQQLEEARKDLQERYSELKQDFREFQKLNKGG